MQETTMQRRDFFALLGAGALVALCPELAIAASADYRRLLILVELKGGNDALNTVVPYADPRYAELRPRIGLRRDEVLQLDGKTGLHPGLEALMPLWQQKELAIIQSVAYPKGNLSHFRSIEIWETASNSEQYLSDGWLARAFAKQPVPGSFIADGAVLGSSELGPLQGARAIALSDPDQFRRQSRLAGMQTQAGPAALQHVLKVESDVTQAASGLVSNVNLQTEFPKGPFGDAVRSACRVVAGGPVAVLRLTLNGFDTHHNQPGTHAGLMKQLGEGLLALKNGLSELGRWQDTLVMTYAEFGRRPKENQSNGTDHGTAAAHFVLGGRVKGGLYGTAPALDSLDGNGNLPFTVDFRSLYATALERWWGIPSEGILGGRFKPLELLRT